MNYYWYNYENNLTMVLFKKNPVIHLYIQDYRGFMQFSKSY